MNNNLTEFNTGGSHNQNKHGGIPLGQNASVEQGETKKNNYIYSDRLAISENMIKQLNLPTYIKGKTFADASKTINNKFLDRNDNYANETKNTLLKRLEEAQEIIKAEDQQRAEEIAQSMMSNQQQIPDMMNGQIPEGMEEYVGQESQQFAFGGDMYSTSFIDPPIDLPIVPPVKKTKKELTSLTIDPDPSQTVNSTVKPIVKIQPGVMNSKLGRGYYVYSRYPIQNVETDREFVSNAGYKALRGTQPYINYTKSYNPATLTYGNKPFAYGGNINSNNPYTIQPGQSQPLTQVITNDAQVEKNKSNSGTYMAAAGQALGSIGTGLSANKQPMFYTKQDNKNTQIEDQVGKTKDSVASAIGPFGQLFRGIEKAGQGVGDSVGGQLGDGIKTAFSPDETVMKLNSDSSVSTGDKILGSLFTPYANLVVNRKKEQRQAEASRQNALSYNRQFSDQYAYGGKLKQYAYGGPEKDISETDREIIDGQEFTEAPLDFSRINKSNNKIPNNTESLYSKASNYLDKNGGEFLKYAPVAMNAYQLSQLKKPENKQLQRLSNRYNPQYVDESQLQNIVRQEGNNQTAAIQQMGGSEGALRNALLATGLNKTKALSDAYMKANESNRSQDEKVQAFNLGVNQFNAQTQHKESEQHEQNAAAYRNEKSKYLSSIGTDLGSIGKEEVNKNQIATALGYSWDGKYMIDKKTGEKITAGEAIKKANNEKKAYGGYLTMNKIGRR